MTSLEPQLYCADTTDMAGAVSLAEVLPAQSEEEDILAERRAGYQDILLYIYTSGTTGNQRLGRQIFHSVKYLFHPSFIMQKHPILTSIDKL